MLAQVGNEQHVLEEWLEHHIAEGASHFYIANRNPEGTMEHYTFLEQVAPYVARGLVTWWQMPQIPPTSLRRTVRHFEAVWSDVVLPRARREGHGEWLLVIDLDEFFYSAHSARVSDVLCGGLPPGVTQVCAPWVFFQNSGRARQPSCVVPSFTHRDVSPNGSYALGKCASRMANATGITVHWHRLQGGRRPAYGEGMPWRKYWGPTRGRPPIVLQKWRLSEGNMHEWPLRINHYAEQSVEHFVRVRSNRTYGITSAGRNESAVEAARAVLQRGSVEGSPWDRGQGRVLDTALSRKGHWRRLGRDCSRNLPSWEGREPILARQGADRTL